MVKRPEYICSSFSKPELSELNHSSYMAQRWLNSLCLDRPQSSSPQPPEHSISPRARIVISTGLLGKTGNTHTHMHTQFCKISGNSENTELIQNRRRYVKVGLLSHPWKFSLVCNQQLRSENLLISQISTFLDRKPNTYVSLSTQSGEDR